MLKIHLICLSIGVDNKIVTLIDKNSKGFLSTEVALGEGREIKQIEKELVSEIVERHLVINSNWVIAEYITASTTSDIHIYYGCIIPHDTPLKNKDISWESTNSDIVNQAKRNVL